MKNTIQKIFITLAGLVVSFAACILGMYMVFLADDMKFGYQMLFSAIFMFNPITTILMAVNMFRRPKTGAPAEEKKPRDSKNPFRKEPKETDPFKKDADFDDSFSKEKDDYASGIFSYSESKDPDKESDDDLFSSHVTVDDEDQFISN
jgi:hypothetical protein